VGEDEGKQQHAVPSPKLPHGCWHGDSPAEDRPCGRQVRLAITRTCEEMEANPTRFQEAVEAVIRGAKQEAHTGVSMGKNDDQPQETPEAASKFPSDLNPVIEEKQTKQSVTTWPKWETILPSAPPEEDGKAYFKKAIAGLRGQALRQVRQYIAILASLH
jgi:hypothetical protein